MNELLGCQELKIIRPLCCNAISSPTKQCCDHYVCCSMHQRTASDHTGTKWRGTCIYRPGGASQSLKQSQGTLLVCMHAACLPAYLLLEYVLLAQARPTMSCIALYSNDDNWGEPERAPPRALQRLRSLSHNWRAGASQPSLTAGPRCRDIYINGKISNFKVEYRAGTKRKLTRSRLLVHTIYATHNIIPTPSKSTTQAYTIQGLCR